MSQFSKKAKKIFSSKVMLLAIVLVLISLTISLGRESYRRYQLDKEISGLEAQIGGLQGDNQRLAGLMEYFKQDSYLEKEARIKLNLKKPGEKVVVLSGGGKQQVRVVSDQPEEDESEEKTEEANYWKWWEFFFSL